MHLLRCPASMGPAERVSAALQLHSPEVRLTCPSPRPAGPQPRAVSTACHGRALPAPAATPAAPRIACTASAVAAAAPGTWSGTPAAHHRLRPPPPSPLGSRCRAAAMGQQSSRELARMDEILTEQQRVLQILESVPRTDQARRSAIGAYLDRLFDEQMAIHTRLGGCPLLLHCCAPVPLWQWSGCASSNRRPWLPAGASLICGHVGCWSNQQQLATLAACWCLICGRLGCWSNPG